MSALRPEGFVGHEWEEDRRLCRDSLLDVVNAAGHF
jgi:hypothetical protein